MRPGGWYEDHPIVLDLAGMERTERKIPIHYAHDTTKIVGHSEKIRGGSKLTIEGVVSADSDSARLVVGSSRNGFPWQASVGAGLYGSKVDFLSAGQTVVVNGRKIAGPVYVARRWRLNEASFVSMGADPGTSAVAAGEKAMEFETWVEDQGFVFAELSEEQTVSLRAMFQSATADGDPTPVPLVPLAAGTPPVQTVAALAGTTTVTPTLDVAAIAAQVSREATAAVTALQAQWTCQQQAAMILSATPEIAAQAVTESWDEPRMRQMAELLTLRAQYGHGPAIHGRNQPGPTERAQIVEAGLMLHGGHGTEEGLVRQYGAPVIEAARRYVPGSASLKYLAHEVLRAAGQYAHPGVFDDDTFRAVLRADRQITATSGFSTLSMSGVLSNLAHKALLNAYQSVASVYRTFCRIVPHSDFKLHSKYRVIGVGNLQEIGPTGEIQHTEMDEDTYTNQVRTYARMIALTRVMMRNDDLGAFLQIPQMFGRTSATTLEMSVFTTLLDNADAFFNASASGVFRANALASGATSALSSASIGLAENLFWDQVDKNGVPINLVPAVILASAKKRRDLNNILNKTTMVVIGDPATTEQMRISNEYQGEFSPVTSPFMSSPAIAGSSVNKWFMFAAPTADVAAFEVAFLDNKQVPTIESAETDFNTLGMQWRTYFDWGVAKQDKRAAVFSPGA